MTDHTETTENTEEMPHCDYKHAHGALIEKLKADTPARETLNKLSDLYKVFGDETRIRILYALFESELCVCDIAQLLSLTVSAASHQLRILKQARLVDYRRSGKAVFYSLADAHVRLIIAQGIDHVSER